MISSSFLFLFLLVGHHAVNARCVKKHRVGSNLNNRAHAALVSPKHMEASKEQQHSADCRSVCPPLIRSAIHFACYDKEGWQKLLNGEGKKNNNRKTLCNLRRLRLRRSFRLIALVGGSWYPYLFFFVFLPSATASNVTQYLVQTHSAPTTLSWPADGKRAAIQSHVKHLARTLKPGR